MVVGSSPVTFNCVAVDMVELEVALKYHMLFVPPVALTLAIGGQIRVARPLDTVTQWPR